MSINIFQGGNNRGSKAKVKANSPSNSVRAKFANDALRGASVASDSGNTAVAIPGTLGKVANTVGNVAGLVSKFVPGTAGRIAGAISNLLNDPEWWRQVPGDAVTMNSPLRAIPINKYANIDRSIDRVAFAEIYSDVSDDIMAPTDAMITQYLMPEIRKVVNAIPLQEAAAYKEVLRNNAKVYAVWQTLKKFLFITEHGKTYMANTDDVMFPLLQVANADKLKAFIGRLEEYMRSSVRLPHTLCEYLAFRFGRVYLSRNSAKASWIMYNAFSIVTSLEETTRLINNLVTFTSATPARQQANTDIFNAYVDHDMQVVVSDDTQYTYDDKEYALRTNLDLHTMTTEDRDNPNPVYINSAQDNPTVFMASVVSTVGKGTDNAFEVLFPVDSLRVYSPLYLGSSGSESNINLKVAANNSDDCYVYHLADSNWVVFIWDGHPVTLTPADMTPTVTPGGSESATAYSATQANKLGRVIMLLHYLKMTDIYNKDVYATFISSSSGNPAMIMELTSPSCDLALVDDTVIANEHVYAFANLVNIDRKRSMTYGQAEKIVAREEANLVDKLQVASS